MGPPAPSAVAHSGHSGKEPYLIEMMEGSPFRCPPWERSGTPRGRGRADLQHHRHDADRAILDDPQGMADPAPSYRLPPVLAMAHAEFGRTLLLMARVIFFPALRTIGLA
jgi:hypothetical protein